jgi:hypothetical protein
VPQVEGDLVAGVAVAESVAAADRLIQRPIPILRVAHRQPTGDLALAQRAALVRGPRRLVAKEHVIRPHRRPARHRQRRLHLEHVTQRFEQRVNQVLLGLCLVGGRLEPPEDRPYLAQQPRRLAPAGPPVGTLGQAGVEVVVAEELAVAVGRRRSHSSSDEEAS